MGGKEHLLLKKNALAVSLLTKYGKQLVAHITFYAVIVILVLASGGKTLVGHLEYHTAFA